MVELPVRPGDRIAEGDLLAVVENNKTTVEVRAERAGTVAAVFVGVGGETAEGERYW